MKGKVQDFLQRPPSFFSSLPLPSGGDLKSMVSIRLIQGTPPPLQWLPLALEKTKQKKTGTPACILLVTLPLTLHRTHPEKFDLTALAWSTTHRNMRRPSNVLIADPIHPDPIHSQRTQYFNAADLQLCRLTCFLFIFVRIFQNQTPLQFFLHFPHYFVPFLMLAYCTSQLTMFFIPFQPVSTCFLPSSVDPPTTLDQIYFISCTFLHILYSLLLSLTLVGPSCSHPSSVFLHLTCTFLSLPGPMYLQPLDLPPPAPFFYWRRQCLLQTTMTIPI